MLSKLIICLSKGSKYSIILHANHTQNYNELNICICVYRLPATMFQCRQIIDMNNKYTKSKQFQTIILKWMFCLFVRRYDRSWLGTALEVHFDKRITYFNHLHQTETKLQITSNEINWIMSAIDGWMLNTYH